MDTTPLALLIGGVSVFLIIAVVTLAIGGRRGPTIAGASLSQPGPFVFQPAPVQGSVKIWLRYSVSFPFERPSGQQTSRAFCLVVELVADGHKMTLGHGGRHPKDALEFEGLSHHMTSFRPGNATTPTRHTATVLVKRLPACPRLLQGAVYVGQGTILNDATITMEGEPVRTSRR